MEIHEELGKFLWYKSLDYAQQCSSMVKEIVEKSGSFSEQLFLCCLFTYCLLYTDLSIVTYSHNCDDSSHVSYFMINLTRVNEQLYKSFQH